jgi:hypothetical protein
VVQIAAAPCAPTFRDHALAGRRRAAHAFDEPLDVAYRRFRQHAMAEIENKWALRESGKNCVDRAVQRRSAGKQGQRIEIEFWRMLIAVGGEGLYNRDDYYRSARGAETVLT